MADASNQAVELPPSGEALNSKASAGMVVVEYEDLMALSPKAMLMLKEAYTGDASFGAMGVKGVPGYSNLRSAAFGSGIKLALQDPEGQLRAASPRYTYPGWIGRPGTEKHPLQSSFIHNLKE